MDWLTRMNSAIKYIEDNITEEIDNDKVAEIACCSVYHFQRMFSFITEISLSEYIRRRRFTLAAFELQNSDARILDIAVKYGYDSADSFSRAFQKLHGVTPSLARDKGVQLKVYPKISFHISIKGDVEMNYRIEEKDGFRNFGVSTQLFWETDYYHEAGVFVDKCVVNGTGQMILDVVGMGDINKFLTEPNEDGTFKQIGLFVHYGGDKIGVKFMIAMDHLGQKVPEHFEVLDIPKSSWAVFTASAPISNEQMRHNLSIEKIGICFSNLSYILSDFLDKNNQQM